MAACATSPPTWHRWPRCAPGTARFSSLAITEYYSGAARVDRRTQAPGRAGAAQRSTWCCGHDGAQLGDGRRGRLECTPLRPAAPQRPATGDAWSASRRRLRVLLAHPAAQRRSRRATQASSVQLSGHDRTGGQYLAVESFRATAAALHRGLHRLKQLWIYTSRGTGYWGRRWLGAPRDHARLRFVGAA